MNYTFEPERIYATDPSGKLLAEVTFPHCNGVAAIDHTFVDESLRGQGIAAELVKLAAEKIQDDGHQIAATCPYAVVWLDRHPEYPTVDAGPAACRLSR